MASTHLSRTASANNNSVGKWTFSCWLKRSNISSEQNIISFNSSGAYRSALRFDGDDKLRFYEVWNSSTIVTKLTNRLFRDTNSWYHIVFAVDKTVSSPDTQIYINGVATTSWATNDDYTQNESGTFDNAVPIYISSEEGTVGYFDGIMTHIHFCDGTKYQASDFGETDATSGVWKPKTQPSVTYGTNGFFLKFANSASLGTDSSGNGNNFTVNGSGTQTLDTPSNVYCTLNPLTNTGVTVSNGNLKGAYSVNDANLRCTLGVNKGKWYWESKVLGTASGLLYGIIIEGTPQTVGRADSAGIYGLQNAGTSFAYADTDGTRATSAGFPNPVANDIVQCALDLDNDKFYMGINGTFYDLSGTTANPATGSNPTWTLNSNYDGLIWFPFYEFRSASESTEINFGNGYFGTTVISSPNSDGAGEGKFAYAPPTGYYALNTKNLKTYG